MYVGLMEVVKALIVFKLVKTGCKIANDWSEAYKEALAAGVVKKGGEAE